MYKTTHVISENYDEYQLFLKKNKLNRYMFKYVSNPGMLIGLKEINYIKIGLWNRRKDINEIMFRISRIENQKELIPVKNKTTN